jgi:hypothetical protein
MITLDLGRPPIPAVIRGDNGETIRELFVSWPLPSSLALLLAEPSMRVSLRPEEPLSRPKFGTVTYHLLRPVRGLAVYV